MKNWRVAALGVFAIVATWLGAADAHADTMDIALARLRLGDDVNGYTPDNDAWRSLVQQQGAALAQPMLEPARTLGYGGFYIGLEGGLTGISSNSDYWQRGTEGDANAPAEGSNRFPSGVLYWQRLNVRKGLPFGFELGSSGGHLMGTGQWSLGFSLKWSIFEGFRRGPYAFIPDVAIRGAVQTMVGDSEFHLTVPTLDIVVSKPFVLAHVLTLSPYIGFQQAWIYGTSEVVDLTPNVDAFTQPTPADYANNATFATVHGSRSRGYVGLQARFQALTLTSAFTLDLSTPGDVGSTAPLNLAHQWTWSFALGMSF